MPTPAWLNPNQPLPPVLASPCCPPPPFDPNNPNMPLPPELWASQVPPIVPIWESLPVVQLDFPMGPYDSTTGCCNGDYSGPLGTGLWPGDSFCPGSGIGGLTPSQQPEETGLAPVQEPGMLGGPRGMLRQQRDLRRLSGRQEESLERQVEQRERVVREDREIDRDRRRRREREEREDFRDRDFRDRDDRGER